MNPPGDGPLRDGTKDLWKDNSKVGQGVHNLIKVITRTACNQRDAVQGKEKTGCKRHKPPATTPLTGETGRDEITSNSSVGSAKDHKSMAGMKVFKRGPSSNNQDAVT